MGLFDIFKGAKGNAADKNPQPMREHHYAFAYKALPGLAFADPEVPLVFDSQHPTGRLAKFWAYVGTKFPENERISDSGLLGTVAPLNSDYAIVFIDMPPPLRETEAYFVAICYPYSWLNDPNREKSKPDLHYFILARSKVPGRGGASGATLRTLNQTGHGAVKFGIPVSAEAFTKEIGIALRNPPQWIIGVESKPWRFFMQDDESGQTYGTE